MNNLHSIVVNGVVFKDKKILVSQRSWTEVHEPGKWTIPGGKVEQSNQIVFSVLEKNLKREIKEETGIEIKNKVVFVTNNSFIRSNDNQHVIVIVFKCEYKSGEPQSLEDTINCKWASQEELQTLDFPPNVKEYILKAAKLL